MGLVETRPAEGVEGRLDPKLKAALAFAPVPDYASMTLEAVRASAAQRFRATPRLDEPVADARDVEAGRVPLRLYAPAGDGPFPALLYFHGGGWATGDLESHDDLCRSLCRRAGVLVASVGYRLSPEARFPAALEDASEALRWLAARPEVDRSRLSVGGDSAGGQLAAALALRARDAIAFQLLIYPVTDRNLETPSYLRYATGFGLTRANMGWFWEQYLGSGDVPGPEAAPLRADDLAGLPPALVVTAEFDVLRDEGEAYAARLAAAGVPVRCLRYLGMNHGFARMAALFPQAALALDDMAAALRAACPKR